MSVADKIVVGILFLSLLPAATAQTITATLQGVVTDASDAVIPGAAVTVVNTATNVEFTTETNAAGRFVAPSLTPGPYRLAVEAEGFKRVERGGMVLEIDQTAQVSIKLEVGALTETIEVTGEAPLLEATTSSMGQVIDNRKIMNLPLNSRNPYRLALLVPGVSGRVEDQFNGGRLVVNGGRPGTNEILVDGVPSSPPLVNPIQGFSVLPSVDSVQEFKVQTNNYSAEYGRSGGSVINMVYKSGTNEFHGTAFEFLRNSRLDANDFFANRNGVPRGDFKRNQFGATAGGPIYIPKVYDGRNKSFIFAGYEGLRQRSLSTQTATVPTELQRSGDFSQTLNPQGNLVGIYDPLTTRDAQGGGFVRNAFANNVIPSSRIANVSSSVVRYYPEPNQPGARFTGVNNWVRSGSDPLDENKWEVKYDQVVSDSQRFFLRFSRRKYDDLPLILFPDDIAVANGGVIALQHSLGAALDYTWTISPTLLLNFRGGISRMHLPWRPNSFGFDPVENLGMPSYIRELGDGIEFPGFAPTGYRKLGDGGPNFRRNSFETHPYSVHATKILTKHQLKFGAEWRFLRVHNSEYGRMNGDYTFGREPTQGPDPTRASTASGDGLASMLLGYGGGPMTKAFKGVSSANKYYAFYVNDDFTVTPKFTLNVGLRYEVDAARTSRWNRMNWFNPDVASPLAAETGLSDLMGGLVFVGENGVKRAQFDTDYNNFAPRIGFAYQATQKLVVRSAYGLFYAPSQMGAGGSVGNIGYRSDTDFLGMIGVFPNFTIDDPFPDGLIPALGSAQGLRTGVGGDVNAFWQDTRIPMMHVWNLNLQYQLPGDMSVEAAYSANRTTHLNAAGEPGLNMNQLTPEQLQLGSALLQRVDNPFHGVLDVGALAQPTVPRSFLLRAYPQYTRLGKMFATGADSIYNSFQLKAQKRFSGGLSLLLAYTNAKLIDTWSGIFGAGTESNNQNMYDRKADRSISGNDISQTMVLSYVYDLPFGRGRALGTNWNGVTNAILGGWQLNGIVTMGTGYPLRLTAANTAQAGNGYLRPNNNGQSAKMSGPVADRLEEYFDTSVFSQPEPFTFGNAGRYLPDVRQPGPRNWDFSLFKNFDVREDLRLQFRAEMFNFTNTPVFAAPNVAINNNNFGRITGQANSPRQIQFGLKLLW
jgi:hypothetical protein